MNPRSKIKSLKKELEAATTNKGQCGCSDCITFFTDDPETYKPVFCSRCGGKKHVVFCDEKDLKC